MVVGLVGDLERLLDQGMATPRAGARQPVACLFSAELAAQVPADELAIPGAVRVGELGLDGDRQCDTRHHGGPDKAVYAYASEDLLWWSSELDRDIPPVMGSADHLKQVFLNLMLNAQEAMPGGGALHITTRLSRETDTEFLAGRFVLVQLSDTGAGIPEEHLPHIFEAFYSTKTDSKGTGLGLWVSQGIVQNHLGHIRVRSRPGRGTSRGRCGGHTPLRRAACRV